jgi:hypothetical protein
MFLLRTNCYPRDAGEAPAARAGILFAPILFFLGAVFLNRNA